VGFNQELYENEIQWFKDWDFINNFLTL
jgi:hypothetical protein